MMHPSRFIAPWAPRLTRLLLVTMLLVAGWATGAQAATGVLISGEIERITIDTPGDHWSGGTIQVGGQRVILPKNLLIDLPANRLTLQELYLQAPAACLTTAETGLAKGDRCNGTGAGGFASLNANRTTNGNVIAGDMLIQKGIEVVTGTVSYINHTDGYVRLNGTPGSATTGVMVRLNDPTSRHTVQQGAGCAGGPNCSPDPRFTLDPDNYVNVLTTGYPYCIPSTVQRTVSVGLPAGLIGIPALPAGTVAQAQPDGSGDVLCPLNNRPAAGSAADSRLFAPIKLGDPLTAEGNFETVGGVRFLSAHSSTIQSGLPTKLDLDQPDYMFLEEVGIDIPAWQNQRIRTLIIGFTTVNPADVLIWSIHRDKETNQAHEFPLASVQGCDAAGGAGTCGSLAFAPNAGDIFRVRHDVDFLAGAKAKLNPCAHLQLDPGQRFGTGICPGSPLDFVTPPFDNMISILSPIPHEIQARTGKKVASLRPGGTPLITLDINGNEATNGQYLFPFGINLGGLTVIEPVEFDLNAVAMPFYFSGIPWNLDRRLSPGGCLDTNGDDIPDCETTPQPLDPFPWESSDPRTQTPIPVAGNYSDVNFTATPLSDTRNRMFSFVNPNRTRPGVPGIPETAIGNFDGNNTLLVPGSFPPVDPAAIAITPVTPVALICTDTGGTGGGALLSVVGAGNGSGTVSPVPVGSSVPFDLNAVITLTATPAIGSTFGGWVGAGCTGTAACVVTLTASTTVTAVFTLQQFPLTVAAAGAGSGTVSPVAAGSTANVDFGPFTLTATPTTGSVFAGWSGDCVGTGACTVLMSQARSVTATFDVQQLTLNVVAAGTGSGTVSPVAVGGSTTVAFNTQVTLTATPNTGSVFSGWSGGGCTGTGTCTVTVTAATTVTATFDSLKAILVSPTSGTILIGSATFNWSAGSGATEYILWVGTSLGRNNLFSKSFGLNLTSGAVNNLPSDGSTIFVRLLTRNAAGLLTFNDYSFTTGSFPKAALLSPTGSPLAGPSTTFTWSAASGATEYLLWVGTAAGRNNLYSRSQGLNLSVTVTNLPTDGSTIFVRLFTRNAAGQLFTDYTFTTGP